MFAISREHESLSPSAMKFANWWIYDLHSFHSFWQQLIQNKTHLFVEQTVWSALLKAYQIHLFSPMSSLIPFAKDFHEHYPDFKSKQKVSDKKIEEVFQIFSHLGLKKVEQLKRFSRDELQKRFGPHWALFFEGILNPESPWKWISHRSPEILFWSFEFEYFCIDSALLFQEISRGISLLAAEKPLFSIHQLEITFVLSEGNENLKPSENEMQLSFTYEPSLQKDNLWILKLIEERLSHFKFDHPVWKFQMKLFPAGAKRSYQLSLFDKSDEISWGELQQKLKDQNFKAFQPAPTFSYLPEKSWTRGEIRSTASFHGLFRPLIQGLPEKISPPESSLKFTERLTWFDQKGIHYQRDYFIARDQRAWIWIFRNEKDEWFKQGIIE
ncbi:MAG: nucleotidyltransferase [Bacteriovoracaceae bacterium]|nr:nucleotidyltransferase [Bacteriovoracaceae bacterium]